MINIELVLRKIKKHHIAELILSREMYSKGHVGSPGGEL